jgi:hypothetical protein
MVGTLLRRLRHVVRQRQLDADVRAEIEFHRDLKQRDLERLGMSSSEAAVAARRAMGNITLAREDARAVWVARWLDTALRNIRHGCRICWNSPTFALTSILTLGLCIGANAAIYTLVDWILIRPLPFPEPDRLAWVETRAEQNGRSVNMQRQTLGSRPRQTFWTAGWPGVAMSVVGISAGLLLARTGAVLLRSLVWGVQTTDPLTFVGAAVVVAVVAVLAVVIPTLRIFRLNPIEALRSS